MACAPQRARTHGHDRTTPTWRAYGRKKLRPPSESDLSDVSRGCDGQGLGRRSGGVLRFSSVVLLFRTS